MDDRALYLLRAHSIPTPSFCSVGAGETGARSVLWVDPYQNRSYFICGGAGILHHDEKPFLTLRISASDAQACFDLLLTLLRHHHHQAKKKKKQRCV